MNKLIYKQEYKATDDLSSQQVKAAVLIGSGEKKKDVAKVVGVSPQTISYWGHNSAFKKLVSSIKLDIMIESRNRMRSLLPASIDSLEKIITSSESESSQLKAIKLVLDQAKVAFPNIGLWDLD